MSGINVNLRPCDCAKDHQTGAHDPLCNGRPVYVPCPIPRSTTSTVRLGKCTCANDPYDTRLAEPPVRHLSSCPARPIKVSFSVSGKTWEESKVSTVERHDRQELTDALVNACGHQWALVKALVLGWHASEVEAPDLELFQQRNAAYAAIAKRVRAEEAGDEALADFLGADIPASLQVEIGRLVQPRISEAMLAGYVRHLLEQVESSP